MSGAHQRACPALTRQLAQHTSPPHPLPLGREEPRSFNLFRASPALRSLRQGELKYISLLLPCGKRVQV
jgi:hypothetical protein